MSCQIKIETELISGLSKNSEELIKVYCNNSCNLVDCFFFNHRCFKNVTKSIWDLKDKDISKIYFIQKNSSYYLNKPSSAILLEIARFLKIIFSENKYSLKFINSCDEENCIIKKSIVQILGNEMVEGLLLINPIAGYKNLNNFLNNLSKNQLKEGCDDCKDKIFSVLQNIKNKIEESKLIQLFIENDMDLRDLSIEDYYKIIFNPQINKEIFVKSNKIDKKNLDFLDYYKVGPYEIQVFRCIDSSENRYEVSVEFDQSILNKNEVLDSINQSDILSELTQNYLNFNKILKFKKDQIKNIFYKENLIKNTSNFEDLIDFWTYKSLGLEKFFPFLLDNNIEEFYLDQPNSYVYLDHSKFGRCTSNININDQELQNFITKIRAENNIGIDIENPIIKTEIITDEFHIRTSINYRPLAVDGFNFSIRKFNKNYLSILDLIRNNTLNLDALTYLMYFLIQKRNILIIGEPGSGKTTLLNAIDLICPSRWRKIYLEDVIESIPQINMGKHQIRLKVKELSNQFFSKQYQVRESLHRTPDIVIIGELIHSETIKAMFFLLKVGLQCTIGTCHGTSPDLIIERWKEDDGISPISIGNLDILIHIGKTRKGRRVLRISEIIKKEMNGKIEISIQNIFERDPNMDTLNLKFVTINDIYYNSHVVKKINSNFRFYIKLNDFILDYTKIRSFLNELIESESLFSRDVINRLDNFWKEYD